MRYCLWLKMRYIMPIQTLPYHPEHLVTLAHSPPLLLMPSALHDASCSCFAKLLLKPSAWMPQAQRTSARCENALRSTVPEDSLLELR